MGEKIRGFMSKEDMAEATRSSNEKNGYSVKLEPFKPRNIKMLVNLSEIEPSVKEYDEDIQKDAICQINMTPDGRLSIGFYNERGNGTSYYEIENVKNFKEGVHFEFE